MNILVGYNGGEVGEAALSLAIDYAKTHNAFIYIVTSMEGGSSEKQTDIVKAEKGLHLIDERMEGTGVQYEAQQSVRGLSPGEDLVQFAKENDINHIFLGIKKKSRIEKIILGSTSRYVILKAPCPVTTTK